MSHVVVVRNRHGRRVADDFAKIPAEFQPVGIVAIVIVNLVAGEEQQVGLDAFQVLDDVRPRNVAAVAGVDGIPVKAATTISACPGFRRIRPSYTADSPCRTRYGTSCVMSQGSTRNGASIPG